MGRRQVTPSLEHNLVDHRLGTYTTTVPSSPSSSLLLMWLFFIALIIRCRQIFVCLIFVGKGTHENLSTTKISSFKVFALYYPRYWRATSTREQLLRINFITAITGRPAPTDYERDLFTLPPHLGSMGLKNPIKCTKEFTASMKVILPLKNLITEKVLEIHFKSWEKQENSMNEISRTTCLTEAETAE